MVWPHTYAPALFELPEQPLPSGQVAPGTAPALLVGASPAHPSNRVEVLLRQGNGLPRLVRATTKYLPKASSPGQLGPAQWFTATLPPLESGQQVDYQLALLRAGQRLATFPEDGSWLSLGSSAGTQAPTAPPALSNSPSSGSAPDKPRWAYDLTFFAALTVDLRAEILGATPEGYRINFFVKEGTVRGPSIDAVVLPEGGDWMCIRPDGIGMVDISITYQTDDGALILERAGGVFDLGPGGYAMAAGGQFTGSPPFYATPSWQTAHPNWQWLNRRQGFGVGRVVLDELQVRCDIYLPSVGAPLGVD
jgi:Protein of unknown function (DUF3237)